MWTCKREIWEQAIVEYPTHPRKHLFGRYWLVRQWTYSEHKFSWWLLVKIVDK